MKPFPALLVLLSMALAGCDSGSKVAKQSPPSAIEVALPIVPEDVLSGWGYLTVSTSSRTQSDWEAREFGGAQIRIQSIKALKEVPDWKDAYYRFTLVEESFPSEAAAGSRFLRLKENDPKLDSKQFPDLILRDGFTERDKVFYVTTDVSRFEIERLPAIVESLKAHVLGIKEGEQAAPEQPLPAAQFR